MENQNNNININEQFKNLTPEAVENAYSAVFKGQINFIKKSPLKWLYIIVLCFILFALIFIVSNAIRVTKDRREFQKSFEETKKEMEERRKEFDEESEKSEIEMEEKSKEFYEEYEENKKIIDEANELMQNKMNE